MDVEDHLSSSGHGQAFGTTCLSHGASLWADRGCATVDITVAGTSESVHLPAAALDVIRAVLANMAAGQGVTVVPAHAELTTSRTLGC